jgi:hypothetical protein
MSGPASGSASSATITTGSPLVPRGAEAGTGSIGVGHDTAALAEFSDDQLRVVSEWVTPACKGASNES